jgi:hypothetical protein
MKHNPTYFIFNGVHIACIGKSGSTSLSKTIHSLLYPNYKIVSASGNQDMVDKISASAGWQNLVPRTESPKAPLILVRDPIDRFLSACAQEDKMVSEAIAACRADTASNHFRPTVDWIVAGAKLYKFTDHLDQFSADAGLPELPMLNASESKGKTYPGITDAELVEVKGIYADDIALFDSIKLPGQLYEN